MIVITGAAGFIGSCMAARLNAEGYNDLCLVDFFGNSEKQKNHRAKTHTYLIDRRAFLDWAKGREKEIQMILHLGARTNTLEMDYSVFKELNVDYSKLVWQFCAKHQIPLIYASSAATYGDGSQGFEDDESILERYIPQNPYAYSKHAFDKWAVDQEEKPYFWAGLKFFNVFGPNEYHKGRMASVVWHAYKQIKETGEAKLFRSLKPEYKNGEQKRDFIYVKDVCDAIFHFMNERKPSGLYNLGTGKARTFNDLAGAIFAAMDQPQKISYIDPPEQLRAGYQYFTEAKTEKLRQAGYEKAFTPLEDAVAEYVREYLAEETYY